MWSEEKIKRGSQFNLTFNLPPWLEVDYPPRSSVFCSCRAQGCKVTQFKTVSNWRKRIVEQYASPNCQFRNITLRTNHFVTSLQPRRENFVLDKRTYFRLKGIYLENWTLIYSIQPSIYSWRHCAGNSIGSRILLYFETTVWNKVTIFVFHIPWGSMHLLKF